MNNTYIKPFEQVLDAVINHSYSNSEPIFYYVAIGSANHRDHYPDPSDRHEYPDYVANLPYRKKVLILIDPNTKYPLLGSVYQIKEKSDKISEQISDDDKKLNSANIQNQFNNFTEYVGSDYDEMGRPLFQIYTIRDLLYIDPKSYHNNIEYVKFGRQFLIDLVSYALMTHNKSLIMISNFTGLNWYHLQDEFINMFDPEVQTDVRNRFLIDSRYYNDLGCYYNLLDRQNQPIIDDGYFFNPGLMAPIEYNDTLHKIIIKDLMFKDQNVDINYEKLYVHNLKKKFMLDIFSAYIKFHLNESYRSIRIRCNETKDPTEKINYRLKMLVHVRELLNCVRDFVQIDQFIDVLKVGSIYSDETELKKIINSILNIDNNILDINHQLRQNQLRQNNILDV